MRSIDELATEICTLVGHINAAHYRWLKLIAEFDERKGWSDSVTQSCAHWLNWKCGIALGAAREKVRVAHALAKLPAISAAMESGRLSYSKVREVTRVGTPENEGYLLMIAERGTASHVEKLVRAYRRCQEAEELSREARQQQGRAITCRYDDDGSLVLTCRLPAESGALVMKALDLAVEHVPAGTSEEPVRFAARRADALALVAESFLAHEIMECHGTDRHQIVVHVAEETLRHRKAGCCEFEHGPSLAAETARRFSCDASVVELIEDEEGEPLDLGRKTRNISTPLRRFLNSRDKGCRFHHRAVHEGGILIEILDDGALRFVKPNGDAVDRVAPGCVQPTGDWRKTPQGEQSDLWRGERMDVDLAVDILIQQTGRSKRSSRNAGPI